MHVYFESENTGAEPFKEAIERRARAATRRLSYAVSQARVKFTSVMGFKGSPENECRVELTLGKAGSAIGTARGTDWGGAMDGALRRAIRALPGMRRRSRGRWRQTAKTIASKD
jgi:hypothetical protein